MPSVPTLEAVLVVRVFGSLVTINQVASGTISGITEHPMYQGYNESGAMEVINDFLFQNR